MTTNSADFERFELSVAVSLHRHWKALLIEGIVLVLLGAVAIILPVVATLAVEIYVGIMFFVAGLAGLFSTLWMRHAPGFWWSLLFAVLATALGVSLLASPISGAVSLTLMLAVFFLFAGIARVMFALQHKRYQSARWSWIMFSGVVDLVLAAVIIAGLPGTAAWAIGLLVGINMMFGGAALIGMALQARSNAPAVRAGR